MVRNTVPAYWAVVSGSNPAADVIKRFITYILSLFLYHCLDVTEIMFKQRLNTTPCILFYFLFVVKFNDYTSLRFVFENFKDQRRAG